MIKNLFGCVRIFSKISKKNVIALFLLTLLRGLLVPAVLFLTQQSVDTLVFCLKAGRASQDLFFQIGLVAAALVSGEVCDLLSAKIKSGLQFRSETEIARTVLKKYTRISFSEFENPGALDDAKAIRGNPAAEIFRVFTLNLSFLSAVVEFAGIAVVLYRYSRAVLVLYLAAVTAVIVFHFRAMNQMNDMMDHQTEDERRLDDFEGLLTNRDSVYELHVNQGIPLIGKKIDDLIGRVLRERLRVTVHAQGWSALAYWATLLWLVASIWILSFQYRNGTLSIGGFTGVIGSVTASLALAENLAALFSQLSQSNRVVKHFLSFLSLKDEPEPRRGEKDCAPPEDTAAPAIEFRHVSFTYPGTRKPILRDISFRVMRGEKIGLVGLNGCGKTTLIQLLLRVYHPEEGEILIGGRPLESMTRAEIHAAFTVVPQDFGRYELTVRENVALSDMAGLYDDERLRAALSAVHMEKFAENPDRPLGRFQGNGTDLSGGQWQDIALARALFSRSCTLLLDEPTASLDPIAEARFYAELTSLLKNRGAVLVTHRLSSVRGADRILLLADGTVAESGTHGELLKKCGMYKEMYESQARWYRKEEACP